MAGVLQHLRSSTLNKRPNPASMVDGQVAINYASGSPGMFFKDSNGSLVKVGPVHVGATAPNVSPASGGTAGNSLGEQWLDTSGGTYVFKIWDGAAWRSEAGEFVNSTGDTMTGSLTMGPSADLIFEGSVDDGFETTLTVVNPTADRTITLPNVSGTIVTTGDSETVTSTMIRNDTIVNADINSSAAIAGTKISPDFGSQTIQTTGIFSAAGGSAAAPSIAFTGDTNTGIYSPGADQVAISTGGSGKLSIDANGHITALVGGVNVAGSASGFGGGEVALGSSSANTQSAISTSATGAPALIFDHRGASNTGSFIWRNSTGGANELMRITGAGLVGVGTSSPSEKLDVYAGSLSVGSHYVATTSTDYKIRLRSVGPNTNSNYTAEIGVAGSGPQPADSDLTFATQTWNGSAYVITEKARLTATGRLGVGTTSPKSILTAAGNIVGLSTGTHSWQHYQQAASVYAVTSIDSVIDGAAGNLVFKTSPNWTNGDAVERVRIDSSGNVGIGTSSPGSTLDVSGTVNFKPASGYNSLFQQSGTALRINYLNDAGSANVSASYRATSFEWQKGDGGPVVNIDSSGRVGIGTTSPSEAFTLGSGNAQITSGQLTVGVTSTSGLQFINDGTFGTLNSIPLILRTASTERARIDTSGRLLVGTSSSSAEAKFIVQGGSTGSGGGVNIQRGATTASAGSTIGFINFTNSSNNVGATVIAEGDGTWTAGTSHPTRLVFSTTADGASSPTERLRIDSNGYLTALGVYNNTTAVAANVHVSSAGGLLFRSTSSIKYKTDVETIQDSYSEALLNCRPVWYRSTCEGDNANWGWWGFIAEEVAEIDPRLVHWKTTEVTYDEKGTAIQTPCDPEPESVQYDRFVPHLLNLIKRQQQAIKTLEAKVAALESA